MDEIERDDEQCACIPENSVIVADCRVVQYMDVETGEMWKADLSHDGSGGPLDPDQINSLTTWLQQVNSVEMLAALMHQLFCHDHDEDEE